MKPLLKVVCLVTLSASVLCLSVFGSTKTLLPATDQRARDPVTLNTLRSFPEIKSKAEWQERAIEVRQQILVSCGLWPIPSKAPLNAKIFGKIERDGYSVEKVYFQTYPGFYLAGNLYRPLGKGQGPFPAVLNPHGHWKEGRLVDQKLGSVAARCISFARQGMVAFCYDMVGYNDTAQVNHKFASNPTNLLWNISLMGLQTWNSIRALDFLESLPDVDTSRIGCTGASGGGTQTFMLGAIDGRLAAQAPNVMVSHSMQGGCLCENAPGLRVEHSNMEVAAVPAPRPQILVAATGDWTKMMLTVEGPAIQNIYKLFNATNSLRYVRFDFDHNYNQTSREAVYEWFGKWLLHAPNPASLKELAYKKEADSDLRAFPDGKMPEDALSEPQLIESLIELAQGHLRMVQPRDQASLEQYKRIMMPAWNHVLQLDYPVKHLLVEPGETTKGDGFTITRFTVGRPGKGDRLPMALIRPKRTVNSVVVLAHPEGQAAYIDANGTLAGLAKLLVGRKQAVLALDTFLTGSLADATAAKKRNYLANYFPTYNRTDLQERVQDLITAAALARNQGGFKRVIISGEGRAGLWALLAAPTADAVVADAVNLNCGDDHVFMEQDLFVPGIHRLGDFEAGALLAAPHPLLLHNTGTSFSTEVLGNTYNSVKAQKLLRTQAQPCTAEAVVDWVVGL